MSTESEKLNEMWYNAIIDGCHLNKESFQLYQGNKPLGDTTEMLWAIFDAIPPKSITHFYDPSQANNFSTDYANVLTVMNSKGLSNMQSVLGDYYMEFMEAWRNAPDTETDMGKFFNMWCSKHCPDKCEDGSRAILAASQDPIVVGDNMWINAGGFGGKAKAYNITIDMVKNKMSATPSATVKLNSKTTSSSVENTWAKGSTGGGYSFFSGSISTEYKKLAQKFTGSEIKADVTFDHLQTVAAGPMYQENSSDPYLSKFKPWYLSSILNDAYNTHDNTVWQSGKTPDWNNTFGENGNMLRRSSAVIVVDGISMTMTSEASFSQSESESFKAAAEGGFWPFFKVQGSGGWSHDTSYSKDGKITVTSKCPKGNPNILGIDQTPAPDYFS